MFAGWCVGYNGKGCPGGPAALADPVTDMHPHDLPYSGSGAGNFKTMDRAIIPLAYPMPIHHVVIASNYSSSVANDTSTGFHRPSEVSYTNEVGVAALRGIRSSDFAYQQIAQASWTPGTLSNFVIDRGDRLHVSATNDYFGYSWDFLSCPLVGLGGEGYVSQGKPVYVGAGETTTATRSTIGNPLANPLTKGAEQALEIRWRISAANDPTTWTDGMIVGYPGHWVYIIGKKHLV